MSTSNFWLNLGAGSEALVTRAVRHLHGNIGHDVRIEVEIDYDPEYDPKPDAVTFRWVCINCSIDEELPADGA